MDTKHRLERFNQQPDSEEGCCGFVHLFEEEIHVAVRGYAQE